MDLKVQQLVEELVAKGLTYQSWILMLAFVIAAGLSTFLGSYLLKKGAQKAHSEIVDKLHDQSVKLTKELAAFESYLTEKSAGQDRNPFASH